MEATNPLSTTDIPSSNQAPSLMGRHLGKILQHLTLGFFIHKMEILMFLSHRIVERIK